MAAFCSQVIIPRLGVKYRQIFHKRAAVFHEPQESEIQHEREMTGDITRSRSAISAI